MDFEGYCVKCRKKQQVKNGTISLTPKGRRMVQGPCPVCKTKVTSFLPILHMHMLRTMKYILPFSETLKNTLFRVYMTSAIFPTGNIHQIIS